MSHPVDRSLLDDGEPGPGVVDVGLEESRRGLGGTRAVLFLLVARVLVALLFGTPEQAAEEALPFLLALARLSVCLLLPLVLWQTLEAIPVQTEALATLWHVFDRALEDIHPGVVVALFARLAPSFPRLLLTLSFPLLLLLLLPLLLFLVVALEPFPTRRRLVRSDALGIVLLLLLLLHGIKGRDEGQATSSRSAASGQRVRLADLAKSVLLCRGLLLDAV